MIIRIRTNVGASKLNVDPTSTFSEFRELVMRTLHIEGPEINLAFDLSGEKLIVPNGKSLSELGIYQGSELFVIGKFEKRIVEKSYINDQGEVVPAGQTLVRVDSKCQADVATANEQKEQLDYTQQQAQQLNQGLIESSAAEAESEAMKGDSDSLAGAPTDAADIPFDYNAYKDVLDYEEMNGVRAPDEAKKMTLLGEPAGAEYDIGATEAGRSLMLAVLSAEVGRVCINALICLYGSSF